MDSLKKRRAPGRPSRLSTDQLQGLCEVYQAGPRIAGFDTDRWTTLRFAEAIYGRFGVRYDPDHVGRIMHKLGLRDRLRTRKARIVEVANVTVLPEIVETPLLDIQRTA